MPPGQNCDKRKHVAQNIDIIIIFSFHAAGNIGGGLAFTSIVHLMGDDNGY
jgi:hypothetical protein